MRYSERLVSEFWALVAKTETCWIWIGARRGQYGSFGFDGVQFQPHQLAWELVNGEAFPAGKLARHLCPNKLCCRPHEQHVVPGTSLENARDRVAAGISRSSQTEVQYTVYFSKEEAERLQVAAASVQRRAKPKMSTYIASAALAQAERDAKEQR